MGQAAPAKRLRYGLVAGIIVALLVGIAIGVILPGLIVPPPPPAPTVKIGVLYPLTGPLAVIGRDQLNAIDLVIDEVNAAGGIKALGGARIELVIGDTRGDPKIGAAEAERLITEHKVHMLVGAYQSAVTATTSEVAERYGIPYLNPDSTSPLLTRRGFKWFFRTTADDIILVKGLFDYLKFLQEKEKVTFKTISIVVENTLWGIDSGKLAREYAEEMGLKVLEYIEYPHAAADVSAEVLRLKAANADILFQASYLADAILYTKTFKTLDYWPKVWLANDAGHIHPDYVKALGKDADYVFSREVFGPDIVKPAILEANSKFKAKYGYDMDGTIARAYTAAALIADVLERAGSLKPEDIRRALAETNWPEEKTPMPWKGIKFDETGQNILAGGTVAQIQGGKLVTIWPPEVAAAKYIWPAPAWRERG